jgi:hypothetical protein
MMPRQTRIAVRFVLAAFAGCAAAWALPAEPYMVLTDGAELYDGEHLVPVRLGPGDILLGGPHEGYPDWLEVTVEGRTLHARAAQCARLSDVLVSCARRRADLLSRSAALGREIAARDSLASQLYAAELAIRFDATVQYRYRELLPPPPAQDAVPPSPPQAATPSYVHRYEDKIAPARARSLAADWARERRRAEREADRLRQQRRDCVQEQHTVEVQGADAQWRFAAFRAQAGLAAPEPYVVVSERTPLYAGTLLAQELPAGTVVLAGINRQRSQWLKVLWDGKVLDAPQSHFLNRLGVERQYGDRAAWLEQAIQDAQDQQDTRSSRRQLLESLGVAADYASRLEYASPRQYPLGANYAGQPYYAPTACPSAAVEVVNPTRARSLRKDCDRDVDDIQDDLRDGDRTLRSWRRELASLAPRLEDLRRRLDSAR